MKDLLEKLKAQGIVITDNTHLGMGFHIESYPYQHISICYGQGNFYISTSGKWLTTEEEVNSYVNELTDASFTILHLNKNVK